MKSRTLTCDRCGHVPTTEEFLSGIVTWWPWLESAWHICPVCGHRDDVAPEPGRIVFGYLEVAARTAFAGMEAAYIPRLKVEQTAAGMRLTLGTTVVEVPAGARP